LLTSPTAPKTPASQVFDAEPGTYVPQSQHPGTPLRSVHGADIKRLAHGHTGQIMKLDLNVKVVWDDGRAARQDIRQIRRGPLISVSPRD